MLGVEDFAGVRVDHDGGVPGLSPDQAAVGDLRGGWPAETERGDRDQHQRKESHLAAGGRYHGRRPSIYRGPPKSATAN